MTIEEKLKDLILQKYHSVREFTIVHDIPYTTIHSIFKRGIGNSSVTNIVKICKALEISTDALADGEIVPISTQKKTIPYNDMIEIKELLSDTKNVLLHRKDLTLDGNPISRHETDAIIDAIDVGVELAKKRKS